MIHKFKFEDENIVMDINSGSVHIVDALIYEIIDDVLLLCKEDVLDKYKNKYKIDDIVEAIEEINELKEQEMLGTEDTYKNLIPAFLGRTPVVKALCLHVAHDCNLACRYCFAGEGEYHGSRGLMSFDVGKASIDFLVKNSGARKNIEVDFFGGEPLMNFDVVKQIVKYAKDQEKEHNKNFRFTLTTNGVLLNDEIIDFLNEHMYNVVLSLDGRPEVNDKMRPTRNDKGSYDMILPKFKRLVEKRGHKKYYIRGTFTHNNLDFSKDVLHMADMGFNEISVEPVVAPNNMSYALKEQDIETLCNEYETLAKEMLKRHTKDGKCFNFFHFMIDLNQGPCVYKRLAGCGSGTEYLAVTPEGDLYPCHQFVGMQEFKMGDIFKGVDNIEKRLEFEQCNVYSKEECTNCWSKFFCSGGCAANSYNFNKNINSTYKIGCDLQKKRLECAIGLQAKNL
ncbi:thioether cross-link-forming SCIFF peptide maturase [Candidatus Epulonipiscium fishelsonii]|uniref:Thioether cross-link-forming SCIFF peptide maturase n=1 Tax=Candidatus Epulonipiscium fishelsonii TaxID=77094 RepID=A0ACC8XGF3_9FIRM|nr:thioether cross-link-forming SCIFF peptide maturase [Epulopiscium sp. SCG-B05WGA-EpuloA1]ONI42651.1 thioether cross-link-forming SCIFF peptide maturase [Epulopiscium sp. SCG-B11WGA-EpuloA1]